MFYRSLSRVEQLHIVEAFTFELGKCYQQAIKERELAVLANVDTDLCEQVAAGLGLPAPKGKPPAEVPLSAALSQVYAEPGSVAGRKVGIIADSGSDLAGVSKLIKAVLAAGAVPLLTAPVGGKLKSGRRTEVVERTLLTTRSIEFDAVVVAAGTTPSGDIKLVTLLQEAFRHCKPLAAWGDGVAVLQSAGISSDDPGVLIADDVDKKSIAALLAALGLHRVWDRAPAVMASAIPPAKKK
jgi:catalase